MLNVFFLAVHCIVACGHTILLQNSVVVDMEVEIAARYLYATHAHTPVEVSP